MSACASFTEHVWKPGECKNCFQPKGQHHLSALGRVNHAQPPPPPPPPPPYRAQHAKVNISQRPRTSTGFKPPVAKKPTIAVKPTMIVVDGAASHPLQNQARSPLPTQNPRSQAPTAVCNEDRTNNNNARAEQTVTNNNHVGSSGLTEVLKEIAGLGSPSDHVPLPEGTARENFLCRINQCYRRSLERKPPVSCLSGSHHEGSGSKKRVALSGEEIAIIGLDGGRFCYPEFSSGDESWDEDDKEERAEQDSWEESDEELLAMEIRMRGQPRFANLQSGSLSPVHGRFRKREKWNTVPLRQKSLQRVCAVDYDDSYDEILNGCDMIGEVEGNVISPSPDHSMVDTLSCPPSSSSSSTTSSSSSSSSGGLFCNGGLETEKDEAHRTTQDVIQDPTMAQAKPYRVVNLEQPVCKPYTVVDVSAAMAGESASRVNTRVKKSSSTRYQEVWTSSTSPRQKIAKTETVEAPKQSCYKSAPTSPTAGLIAHTVPVRSPNLSEIKFNSYNNAGMPPFPIIIHDEPEYAHSCKSADKVPILINPSAYDNLAIYRSFVGAGGVFPPPPDKERRQTGSHTYEEIETPARAKKREDSTDVGSNETGGCPRESANRVLSQIVASIQPPRSPPEALTPESHSSDEHRPTETQSDPEVPVSSLGRPKALFSSHSEALATINFNKSSPAPSSDDSPTVSSTTEPLPPFPPPRSTSSPYHATMMHKHFATRGRPAGTNRPSPSDTATTPRRPVDGKPRRWISFKSFFRRKKDGSGQGGGDEKGEEGKLVGIDGTVIHMLPPPPVQRHHWFSESRGDPGEKPSIVFVCRTEEERAATSPQESVGTETRSSSTPEDLPGQGSPLLAPIMLPSPSEMTMTVTETVPPPADTEVQAQEESTTASNSSPDGSPGGATYSNLGHSRANMIPYKQPRQTRGGSPPQELEPLPSPPPLPKKNVTPRQSTPDKSSGPALSMANPTYDTERSWEVGGNESGDSVERPKVSGGKIAELQSEALRRFYARCEDIFMAGQREPVSFGLESWPDFRLASSTPCCQAGDAVYYRASYARDPGNLYAVKICRSKSKQAQREYYNCLAVRQGLTEHFNIQQDCGQFLAEVPARLLPWEDPNVSEEEEEQEQESEETPTERKEVPDKNQKQPSSNNQGSLSKRRSRVVVITREPPRQTLADFVREGEMQHRRDPEMYERQVCLLLLQLCGALEHLKAQGITHCDLRLDNLLLASCRPGDSKCSCCRRSTEEQNDHSKDKNPSEQKSFPTCAGRLLLTNFSQAKLKSQSVWRPQGLGDPSRMAPEIVGAAQYRRSDEFQTGILIYEMLHLPNPFQDGGFKEREYGPCDLPSVPRRSPYSRGLGRLAGLLLQHSPSDRLQVGQAKAALRCLIWGPREEVLQGPGSLHSWLEVKRTLLLIKLAERALEKEGGVTLEDWLCCQYLAFGTAQGLAQTLRLLEQN